jgi:hypothetical protein
VTLTASVHVYTVSHVDYYGVQLFTQQRRLYKHQNSLASAPAKVPPYSPSLLQPHRHNMSHNAVHSYATALATAVLLIAVFSPGAAAAVLCGTMPGPVLNSASGAATPAWLNGDGDACINQTVATVCTANCRPG